MQVLASQTKAPNFFLELLAHMWFTSAQFSSITDFTPHSIYHVAGVHGIPHHTIPFHAVAIARKA